MSVIKKKRIASQQEQKPSSLPRVVIILVIRISLSLPNSYKGDSSMESLMFLLPCILLP